MLVLLGLVGLGSSLGLMGAIQTSPVTDLFHLTMGVFFLYVGLWQRDSVVARQVVGGGRHTLSYGDGAHRRGPLAMG